MQLKNISTFFFSKNDDNVIKIEELNKINDFNKENNIHFDFLTDDFIKNASEITTIKHNIDNILKDLNNYKNEMSEFKNEVETFKNNFLQIQEIQTKFNDRIKISNIDMDNEKKIEIIS